jgi:hypothetical protein
VGSEMCIRDRYRKELEQVIKDDTSGDFETLLVELCKVCVSRVRNVNIFTKSPWDA